MEVQQPGHMQEGALARFWPCRRSALDPRRPEPRHSPAPAPQNGPLGIPHWLLPATGQLATGQLASPRSWFRLRPCFLLAVWQPWGLGLRAWSPESLVASAPKSRPLFSRPPGCLCLVVLRAVRDAKPQHAPPRLDQQMFLWASYVIGQDRNEVWWPTDLVSGYKRGPECRINSTCT
jgi:hypothetical protein